MALREVALVASQSVALVLIVAAEVGVVRVPPEVP